MFKKVREREQGSEKEAKEKKGRQRTEKNGTADRRGRKTGGRNSSIGRPWRTMYIHVSCDSQLLYFDIKAPFYFVLR